MKKSLLCIILVVVMLFALAGCESFFNKNTNNQLPSGNDMLSEWLDSVNNAGTTTAVAESKVELATNIALRSVVCINSYFNSLRGGSYGSTGSGVIFHEDDKYAYIVTNYHVLYDASGFPKISNNIDVMLYGMYYEGFEIPATYIGGSLTNDIAVIRIEKTERYLNSACTVANIADSMTATTGQTAIAVGNPKGEGISATSGIVSIESEQIDILGADEQTRLELRVMRIDTPVNPGNSGGGLFNDNGELIGIVNAKYVDSETDSIGYAIPSNIAITLANRLLNGCNKTTDKVVFGIEMHVNDVITYSDKDSGLTIIKNQLIINDVTAGSVADGKLQRGDVLVSFTYQGKTIPITRLYTLSDYIFLFKQNDSITFTVLRNGEEKDVSIVMSKVIEVK